MREHQLQPITYDTTRADQELNRVREHIAQAGLPDAPTLPNGSRISHTFQIESDIESDEETPEGVYVEQYDVASWEYIPDIVDRCLSYPDTAGHTVAITICQFGQDDKTVTDAAAPREQADAPIGQSTPPPTPLS